MFTVLSKIALKIWPLLNSKIYNTVDFTVIDLLFIGCCEVRGGVLCLLPAVDWGGGFSGEWGEVFGAHREEACKICVNCSSAISLHWLKDNWNTEVNCRNSSMKLVIYLSVGSLIVYIYTYSKVMIIHGHRIKLLIEISMPYLKTILTGN